MSTKPTPVPVQPRAAGDEGARLRERKKRTTWRALQMAGLSLVAERGLHAVTTEQIAAEAGVSQRTLFNYFTSKEDVLVGTDPDLAPALAAILRARPAAEPPLESLKQVFLGYAEAIAEDQHRWQLRMQVVDDNPELLPALVGSSAVIGRELTRTVAARTGMDPETDTYPSLVVNVSLTTLRTVLHKHAAAGFAGSLTALTAAAFEAVMAGLPSPD